MRIIGADACKDRLVYCVIDSENMPKDLNQFYLNGANFFEAYTSAKGLKEILDLKPDVLAIEPTGMNYTKLWVRKLSESGVKVAAIGHTQLRSYRTNLGLPDKDDPADALAIAAYYAEHHQNPARFVLLRDSDTAQLRELALRLGHLVRLQSPMINRLQQDLSYAFPERANTSAHAYLFWRWLGGTANNIRYDAQLAESIGSGIHEHIRFEARLLSQVQAQERRVEQELRAILSQPQYAPYRQVLNRYGIGEKAQAIIISQIYPLENFLGEDRQPIVLVTKGKKSGTPTAKHISERKVCKMLGVAPTREQSGKSSIVTKKSGSQLCRNAFWLWLFTRIEPDCRRLKTARATEIYKVFQSHKTSKPIKLARAKTIGKVAKMIFYDLVNEINRTLP